MEAGEERVMSDLTRTYHVASGLSVEFQYKHSAEFLRHVTCVWEPEQPDRLRGAAWRRYKEARADFVRAVWEKTGQVLLVVDGFGLPPEMLSELALAMTPAQGGA